MDFGFLVWFTVWFVCVVCSLVRYLVCCWLLSLGGLGVLGLVLILLVCCGLAICLVACWFPSITFTVDYCGGLVLFAFGWVVDVCVLWGFVVCGLLAVGCLRACVVTVVINSVDLWVLRLVWGGRLVELLVLWYSIMLVDVLIALRAL